MTKIEEMWERRRQWMKDKWVLTVRPKDFMPNSSERVFASQDIVEVDEIQKKIEVEHERVAVIAKAVLEGWKAELEKLSIDKDGTAEQLFEMSREWAKAHPFEHNKYCYKDTGATDVVYEIRLMNEKDLKFVVQLQKGLNNENQT